MEKCKCGSVNIFKREVLPQQTNKEKEFKIEQHKYIEYMCMDCTYTIRVKIDN
jgi:predicted nucleic-acid-binding Zn-ribbon protein